MFSVGTATFLFVERLLCFSEEGSFVKYSHKVWGTHEISQPDQNVFK
jgi:hypothetical protein